MPYHLPFLFFFLICFQTIKAQEIREYLDLQTHPAMHIPYSFFSKGLVYFDSKKPPKLKYKHTFKNVNYANYLEANKGSRIVVVGALTYEYIRSKKRARKVILKQINYVNDFVAAHPDKFVLAKTPQEVRDFVHNSDKTIIVHSIEGAKKVINNAEDAKFWAEKGVAFVTLIHLVDSDYGAAAIAPRFVTRLLNMKGLMRKASKRGLTEKGRQTILWLAQAGIMTDLTHAADKTRTDALAFMKEKGIPPISTHDGFKPIQNNPRGISAEEILQFYQQKGLVSLPVSGESLMAYKPEEPYKTMLDSMTNAKCYCEGSIDAYKFTYLALKAHIEEHAQFILGDSLVNFKDLHEAEKVKLSIGFQTDFNGWLNHHRPRYGKHGCYKTDSSTLPEIERKGLVHPGLMEQHWELLQKEGVDLEPIKRSSERFVQLWQFFLDNKNNFK